MAIQEGFQAVEAMQAASQEAGWECEYRQIEAGQLEAKSTFQEAGGSSFICETSNRRIEVAARAPKSAVTVLIPLAGTQVQMNGRQLSDDRIMVLAPNIDFHAVSNSGAEVWSVHLPTDMLDEDLDAERLGTELIESRAEYLAEFRAAIQFAQEINYENVLCHLEAHVVQLFQNLMLSTTPATSAVSYHRRHNRKALVRAMDFIEANLNKPLRIGQLCTHANVSQSTLERLFRSEFQLTPSNYVRARRLHAVRRELQGGLDDTVTIADVATTHGFTHMGRFASTYRQQFGRFPSEDKIQAGS